MKQLTESKRERDSFRSKLSACVEKLFHLSTRNVNKRINTQKNHVALLKKTVSSQEKKIENFEEEAKELNKKIKEVLSIGVRERKNRYYRRDIAHKHSSKETQNNMFNPMLIS